MRLLTVVGLTCLAVYFVFVHPTCWSVLAQGLPQAKPLVIKCYLLDLGIADPIDGPLLHSHFPGACVTDCPFSFQSFEFLSRLLSCCAHQGLVGCIVDCLKKPSYASGFGMVRRKPGPTFSPASFYLPLSGHRDNSGSACALFTFSFS